MGLFDVFKCDVKVHLTQKVFFPGNVVSGFVDVKVKSAITFVGIRVKVTAKERVVITRRERRGKHTHTRRYAASSSLWKQLLTLAGQLKNSKNRTEQTLPPGNYVFPFQFQIPMGVPPSFVRNTSDDRASLTYCIKAYIDIPRGKDAKFREYFTVLSPIPAAQWIERGPVSVDRTWRVTCCCFDKGVVSARIYMDRSLFAIDRDSCTIYADIDNSQGKEPVNSLEVSLNNHVEYRAQGRIERNVVRVGHNVIQQVIPAGGRGVIQGIVPVPRSAVPTVATMNCTSSYVMSIELNIPNASDPAHSFPVMLSHCVDETNTMPPVSITHMRCAVIPAGAVTPEFYYALPPHPVCQPVLPPLPPPPMAPMMVYGAPTFGIMPQAATWDAAVSVLPTGQESLNGPSEEAMNSPMPPGPPPPGYPQAAYSQPGPATSSAVAPLVL